MVDLLLAQAHRVVMKCVKLRLHSLISPLGKGLFFFAHGLRSGGFRLSLGLSWRSSSDTPGTGCGATPGGRSSGTNGRGAVHPVLLPTMPGLLDTRVTWLDDGAMPLGPLGARPSRIAMSWIMLAGIACA